MKPALLIAGAGANILLVLLLAPLFEGILRKLTARIQSRRGPPLLQPFFDLLKLLGKEDLETGEMPGVQRAATALGLAAVLTTACLLPLGFGSPLNQSGDVILLIYLLTFCGVCTLVAGLASGSTFSMLGSSREVMCLVTLEPILAVAILVGAIHGGSFQLDTVLNGSVYAPAITDLQQQIDLFMSTCQRCGRCFTEPTPLDKLKQTGYRFDDLAHDRWVFKSRSFLEGAAPVDDLPLELD